MTQRGFCVLIGSLGQWVSVFFMLVGIYVCVHDNIDSGTILFSAGCFMDVLATKFKYYGDRFIKRNKKILIIMSENKNNGNNEVRDTVVGGGKQLDFF